jgi:hypothetical protein
VPAEQVTQAFELAVQSLVLRDDGPATHADCQLLLQPLLVGKQLPFPVAQRPGTVEVPRVEGGLLLLPYPGELLRGVDKGGHQLSLRVFLPGLISQQFQYPVPDLGMVGAEPGQCLGRDALAVAEPDRPSASR